ncbi:unnamed protein product, partial [Meganyctiphanes norvegica]
RDINENEAYSEFEYWLLDTHPAPGEIIIAMSKRGEHSVDTGQDRVDYLFMGLATLEHMVKGMKLLEAPHGNDAHISVIEGPWEDVLLIVIPHLRHFKEFSDMFCYERGYKTQYFIANILCFPAMCPN